MPQVRTVRPNGERIRELRVSKGLTPEQLAAKIGGNRHGQTIRRLERGAIEAASEVLIAQIAIALGTKPTEITEREPNGRAA